MESQRAKSHDKISPQKETQKRTPTKARLAVVDLETDPEEYDGTYLPFVAGFYDGYKFQYFWDRPGKPGSCIADFAAFLHSTERPFLIYAHNGGKFDFMLMLDHLEKTLHIQNSRIVRCHIGIHELRDSFAIIPVALDKFAGLHEKQKIGETREEKQAWYKKHFNRKDRLRYKPQTLSYLKDDCLALYDGVKAFREEFGDKLTIGSTAMTELKKLHPFQTGGASYDVDFRNYYFGGRNQCFRTGLIQGDFKIFDVNSMYPHVMRECQHPISTAYNVNVKITKATTFALIDAKNYGCLPRRTKQGLDFTCPSGTFHASIHEINAGLETGTLKIQRVRHTIEHKETTTFATFVDHFYRKRLIAREQGLDMLVTFYKLILNSAYGKFAQNPENYQNYIITRGEIPDDVCPGPLTCPHIQGAKAPSQCPIHWSLDSTNGDYFIWSKPSNSKIYFNVATAASITAAARALLLRGLAVSVEPLYCDTDSIIAKKLDAEIDGSKLGAWKREGEGNVAAIAGKKLYAIFNGLEPIKQASKGVILTAKQIREICNGRTIKVESPVPHFKFDGSHHFVTRRIVATGKPAPFRR